MHDEDAFESPNIVLLKVWALDPFRTQLARVLQSILRWNETPPLQILQILDVFSYFRTPGHWRV